MMSEQRREIAVGSAVFAVAVLVFLYSSLGVSDPGPADDLQGDTYALSGRFGQADGVAPGTEVRMAGLPVGEVTDMRLDQYYRAVLTMRISSDIQLPIDSAAMIQTDGLLGGKFVELEPGGALDILEPGDQLDYTQDSVIIESLLAKVVARAKQERGLDPSKPVGY